MPVVYRILDFFTQGSKHTPDFNVCLAILLPLLVTVTYLLYDDITTEKSNATFLEKIRTKQHDLL